MLCTEEENEEQERESVYKPQERSLLPLLPGYFECLCHNVNKIADNGYTELEPGNTKVSVKDGNNQPRWSRVDTT